MRLEPYRVIDSYGNVLADISATGDIHLHASREALTHVWQTDPEAGVRVAAALLQDIAMRAKIQLPGGT